MGVVCMRTQGKRGKKKAAVINAILHRLKVAAKRVHTLPQSRVPSYYHPKHKVSCACMRMYAHVRVRVKTDVCVRVCTYSGTELAASRA